MRSLLCVLAFLTIFACSSRQGEVEEVRVSGTLRNPNNGIIYLEEFTNEGYEKIDSSRLDDNNQFVLSASKGEKDIYRINFFGRQKVNVIIGENDLTIKADGNRATGYFQGDGSEEIKVISLVNQLATEKRLKSEFSMFCFIL